MEILRGLLTTRRAIYYMSSFLLIINKTLETSKMKRQQARIK